MAEPDEGDEATEDQPAPEEAQPNAADPKALKEQRRKARRSKDQAKDFWRRVFGDEVGRREMWRLLQEAHTFEERFACGPNGFPQETATWYQAGERDFGLRLYHSFLVLDPEGVLKMHTECDNRFAKNKKRESD